MSSKLSLDAYTIANLPSASDVLDTGKAHVDGIPTWKTGKKHGNVQLYSHKADSGPYAWHARISHHPESEVTFDELWGILATDHYEKEAQYINALKRVELIAKTPIGEVWALHYGFPPPVAPRVFIEHILISLDDTNPSARIGTIVQIPVEGEGVDDHESIKSTKEIKGKYASVEQVREVRGEDGTVSVEWRMTTCSSPGGSIPNFISERSIPGEIVKDVTAMLDFVKKQRGTSS